ncbi:protein split ends-like isoform X2 [Physella acuta]|uniref:protein split ends-like isoform X2 n=1 Tax=Physella acuta TaxID=109671 RepID=UPI0027DE76C6|nr:protein split ends-like isoform X2 [Physella acuta]
MEQENLEDSPKDNEAIQQVINKVKSQGLFDQFRKECLADVDTKPAYHNLIQRVEKFVERFLNSQKWTSSANKNQLRETLRRQLNNSGVMSIGVDRIIEQVVNPKILQGIKPKIDEAVCDHLGIDLKARQEEQHRRKQEQQQVMLQQQHLQQQHLQTLINQNVKAEDTFAQGSGILPTPDLPWSQTPGHPNFLGGMPGGPMGSNPGGPFNPPGMGFGGMMQPFSFMGPWGPGLPGMEGFNQPMIPGQPMIPAFSPGGGNMNSNSSPFNTSPRPGQSTPNQNIHDFSKPPPGLPSTPLLSSSSSITSSPGVPGLSLQSSPVAPPGVMPSNVGPLIRPPPPGSVPPPPGTVPVITPPGLIPPMIRSNVPTTPNIPALISHTLSKVSKDDLTPEKIAVFKTAAAFITKTVNNAQGTPGADLATMFSPRVLAEAMMAESGAPMTKHELRAAKRKERMKEFERLKAERDKEEEKRKAEEKAQEDPLPPKHNLMDVFQAAEDVSDDEESFNMLVAETEDKHKEGIVLSEDSDKEGEAQPPTSQPGKRYNFAWDVDKDPAELSDVTVSSIHTSDISSFEDTSSSDIESDEGNLSDNDTAKESGKDGKDGDETADSEAKRETESLSEMEEKPLEEKLVINEGGTETSAVTQETLVTPDTKPVCPEESSVKLSKLGKTPSKEKSTEAVKPRKLISLSYKYSDSEEDETREERKARIAKEKEERYLKRQQRRAEMEAKRKEREEERARLKEEKKKQKEKLQSEVQEDPLSQSTADASSMEDLNTSTTSIADQESPTKSAIKRRKKAQIKEQLHQQKVLERKAALRRQRTRNRRYTSGEFTSIFSEHKTLNQSYNEPVLASQEIVTFDGSLEVVEMTVDQECVVETVGETVEVMVDTDKADDLTLQCPSPYSDISDRSMSERSDDKTVGVEMEQVSSDEDLSSDENTGDDKVPSPSLHSSDSDEGQIHESDEVASKVTSRSRSSCAESIKEMIEKRKSPDVLESRVARNQRYDMDDLYKPRTSHRRPGTPPFSSIDVKSQKSNLSDDEKASQNSCGDVSKYLSQTSTDTNKESVVEPNGEDSCHPKEPVDMMAELELEPVSDEESSLDNLAHADAASDVEKEEGEEKDSDSEVKSVKKDLNTESTSTKVVAPPVEDEASDEGEIKSDSDEAVSDSNEDKERLAYKKPIELVDFGEAEKRARGARGYYPEVNDRRSVRAPATTSTPLGIYRGGYSSWTESGSYIPTTTRYPGSLEIPVTSHVKSPISTAYDGAESEASSHSRSSVRLRDDGPPPYSFEAVAKKRHSPGLDQGSASVYKTMSPPSPVSPRSRSSSSERSKSSSSSSGSISCSSSSSRSSHHKKKRKHRKKKRKTKDKASSIRSSSSAPKLMSQERTFSPLKPQELMSKFLSEPLRERRLSSGHESISSDELPYFPDEEPLPSPPQVKRKQSPVGKSPSTPSSGASPPQKRRKESPSKESISSSELIYSPTRRKSQTKTSDERKEDEDIDDDDDNVSIERPPISPGGSSISSGELPDYSDPDHAFMQGFSPHQPPLPSDLPPLPQDIDHFQPPLPPSPPPFLNQAPLPPLPINDENCHISTSCNDDEEEGEIIEETDFPSESSKHISTESVSESTNSKLERHPPQIDPNFSATMNEPATEEIPQLMSNQPSSELPAHVSSDIATSQDTTDVSALDQSDEKMLESPSTSSETLHAHACSHKTTSETAVEVTDKIPDDIATETHQFTDKSIPDQIVIETHQVTDKSTPDEIASETDQVTDKSTPDQIVIETHQANDKITPDQTCVDTSVSDNSVSIKEDEPASIIVPDSSHSAKSLETLQSDQKVESQTSTDALKIHSENTELQQSRLPDNLISIEKQQTSTNSSDIAEINQTEIPDLSGVDSLNQTEIPDLSENPPSLAEESVQIEEDNASDGEPPQLIQEKITLSPNKSTVNTFDEHLIQSPVVFTSILEKSDMKQMQGPLSAEIDLKPDCLLENLQTDIQGEMHLKPQDQISISACSSAVDEHNVPEDLAKSDSCTVVQDISDAALQRIRSTSGSLDDTELSPPAKKQKIT